MSNEFTITAFAREDIGKGASRRLRREKGLIPGIIYGGSEAPQKIELEHRLIIKATENEAFFSHILDCDVDGKTQKVVVKDLQRHPYKRQILHIDLLRVSASDKITMQVPLHFIGEEVAPGVKLAGGVIAHQMTEVEIRCLPKDLPEFIEVDVSNLDLDQILHLSDIKLPKGVELTAFIQGDETHDHPVVSIHLPRSAKEETAETPEEAAAFEAEGQKPEAEGE